MLLFYVVMIISATVTYTPCEATNNQSKRNTCDEGFEWDSVVQTCRPCLRGTIFNTDSRTCTNATDGSKNCNIGFQFNIAKSKCEDIDECNQEKNQCKSMEYCVNYNGSYKCKPQNFCGQGYKFDYATKDCTDVNECVNGMNNCGSTMICLNIPGSFSCRLPCPKEKKYYWNSGCNQCPEGFNFNGTLQQCVDIDECDDPFKLMCSLYKEKCVRMPGLSKCVTHCSGGTKMVKNICYDIDECFTKTHNCTSDKKCINVFGTYECETAYCDTNEIFNKDINSCECKSGFTIDPYRGDCKDIDECGGIPRTCGINGNCINVPGNFSCTCHTGFHLINMTCEDINECIKHNGICGSLICENLPGSYRCVCPTGFRPNDYDICEDINECDEFPGICNTSYLFSSEIYRCFNFFGSYKCIKSQCPTEYQTIIDNNNIRCELINPNCSLKNNKDCLQVLPNRIFQHDIKISRIFNVPQKVATVDTDLRIFDSYNIEIIVRKVVDSKTKHSLQMIDFVMLTHDESTDMESLFLTKLFAGPTEIVCDMFLKYSYKSEERIDSQHQYHIFVENGSL